MQQHSLPSHSDYSRREVKGIPVGGRFGKGPLPLFLPRPFFVTFEKSNVNLSRHPKGEAINCCSTRTSFGLRRRQKLIQCLQGPTGLNFPTWHQKGARGTAIYKCGCTVCSADSARRRITAAGLISATLFSRVCLRPAALQLAQHVPFSCIVLLAIRWQPKRER